MADTAGLPAGLHVLIARNGGLHPPPDILQSWPLPNFKNPDERGWEAPTVLIIVMGLTFLIYIARMWARLALTKNAGLDDILMSLAMLPVLGLTISVILAIKVYGFQWHVWDQTNKSQITTREITMAIELNYITSTTLIKVAILVFYHRITRTLRNTFVYSVWGMIAFCVVPSIIFAFLIIFTCTPVEGFFRLFDISWKLQNDLRCQNEAFIIVACAIVGTIQDFFLCLLPIILVWNLNMSTRQKVALCGIFGVGMITCVCGILRTYYATYVYFYTYDITWHAYHGWIWTALEADIGVMCASAPALKVFFKRYFTSSTMSNGYSSFGTRKTPRPLSQSRGQASRYPITTSRADHSGVHEPALFQGIKVSQGLDIHVEETDDII
ncbi:hypothetical protein BDU57DRAFT_453234 [Ampelomyces quisqualis]|uniref:Rhodopsin domain-containing protein n=1 Tax=Ampelomyces quisqualis TaxID=50730 RepID=A0A6A5QKZ4_AMPQU|nr:hypothetical protein BDU57DRAFT_453234 [Ampelomyces quisqualis]